ncbi:MAG: DUF3810 domain-containing protein [Bacillota bacterium]
MLKSLPVKRLYFILLIPIGYLISILASMYPMYTERYYSMGIYRVFAPIISTITGIFPFSIAELSAAAFILFLIYKLISMLLFLLSTKNDKLKYIMCRLINFVVLASIIYFSFIMLWGLNYHRLPFSDIAGLRVEASSTQELKALCIDLAKRTNQLRENVKENSAGVMTLSQSKRKLFQAAKLGYDNASKLYNELSGDYGTAKGILLSRPMSYTGISGIYSPFTVEANVNLNIPDSSLASTVCHEMAHQRGFAREDEANYIAYITCSMNPDYEIQYSGLLLALIHSMNALYANDSRSYNDIYKSLSEGVRKDLKYSSEFWKQYEGPVEEVQEKVNDAYLRSNLQEEGIKSYGRMVDLLIAEYKAKTNPAN